MSVACPLSRPARSPRNKRQPHGRHPPRTAKLPPEIIVKALLTRWHYCWLNTLLPLAEPAYQHHHLRLAGPDPSARISQQRPFRCGAEALHRDRLCRFRASPRPQWTAQRLTSPRPAGAPSASYASLPDGAGQISPGRRWGSRLFAAEGALAAPPRPVAPNCSKLDRAAVRQRPLPGLKPGRSLPARGAGAVSLAWPVAAKQPKPDASRPPSLPSGGTDRPVAGR